MLHIIDMGAHDGCSARKLIRQLKKKQIENFKIYCFEGNPYFSSYLTQLSSMDSRVIVCNTLAWIKNEKIKFFLSQMRDDGSSIFGDKTTNFIQENKFLQVDAIDIGAFVDDLPQHDEIWLKMDIEGSEYKILPHLNSRNILERISRVYIEWHYKKIPSITKQEHDTCVDLLKNIPTYEWNALKFKNCNNTPENYKKFLRNSI